MADKKKAPEKKLLLGRVSSHLKMGIVGLPNVGKSSLFNLLTKCEAKAENYPFCTIDPNNARVPLPDARFNWLVSHYKPAKEVPGALEVVDIAGLVPGAHKGEGLGNAFLNHISAVDGIYHMIRVFPDPDVTHTEGAIEPIRDLGIISSELRLKDLEFVKKHREPIAKKAGADPTKRPEVALYDKVIALLESGKDVRNEDWNVKEVEFLNEMRLLTSKPVTFLVNLSEKDFLRQSNKWLKPIFQWVNENSPGSKIIPLSVSLEEKVFPLEGDERAAFLAEQKAQSQLDKIIRAGFDSLNLINFFTVGPDEVRAWPLMSGMTAPKAAGSIHSDFEKCFIKAEVMKYTDLVELGSEVNIKAAGKYYMKGKNYEVEDGDILLIKHNAGGAPKK
jgi:obg-like ATPase 1